MVQAEQRERIAAAADTGARAATAQAYDELRGALEALAGAITRGDRGRPAVVFRVPYLVAEAEAPSEWQAQPCGDDEQARAHAAEMFCAMTYAGDQDERCVRRAPGLIPASRATLAAAARVNEAKEAFYRHEQQIANARSTRRDALNLIEPALCVMQAVRHIHVLSERPHRVNFHWVAHGATIEHVCCAHRRAEIAEARRRGAPPEHPDPRAWDAHMRRIANALKDIPGDEVLAERSVMAPYPRVAFRLGDGRRRYHPAALPLLYPDDGADLPTIKPPPVLALDGESSGGGPPVKRESEPIVAGSGLYRYQRAYRQRGDPALGRSGGLTATPATR